MFLLSVSQATLAICFQHLLGIQLERYMFLYIYICILHPLYIPCCRDRGGRGVVGRWGGKGILLAAVPRNPWWASVISSGKQ